MMDLNKLRSEFEELPEVKQWIDRLVYGDNSEVYIPIEETEENNAIATWINGAWFVWKLKAKAQAVPEGYVVVPREPTKEMLKAGIHNYLHQDSIKEKDGSTSISFKYIYQEMIGASESGEKQ